MASTSCAFSVTARPRATNKSTARGKRVVRARAADAEAAPAVDVSSTEVRSRRLFAIVFARATRTTRASARETRSRRGCDRVASRGSTTRRARSEAR
jgi:hypothetical protein